MDNIVTQMVILLLLVVAGFISNKCGLTGGDFDRRLSNFIINVSCPSLILSSVMGDVVPDRRLIIPLLVVGFLTYVALFGVAWLLPRYFVREAYMRGMYSFMLMFGNVGFIGYPVVASIFGPQAVFYACLLNVPNTLFIFVVGTVFVLGGGGKLRFSPRTLYCPGMIASYLSIVIVAMGWEQVPRVVAEPLRLLGGITVPGALLVIGSSMANIGRSHMLGSPRIYVMAALRLMAIPVLIYALSALAGVDETVNRVNTVIIGMPVASYGTMFCLKYGRDETEMVRGTLVTTILSVVTIPLLTYILF
ncbi:MAG TPA: AEC family transporter [Candidatus Prevotella stercoripullorum]|nr:AEC family transporter [Candidatus Prevotella stercoripullorum]